MDTTWTVGRVLDPRSPDVPAAVALLQDILGPGYGVGEFCSMVVDREQAALFVARDGTPRAVVGVATALVAGPSERARLDRSLARLGLGPTGPPGRRVGVLRTLAVAPDARGKGIGDALVRARLEFLRSAGCAEVYVASWLSGARGQSLGLLRRNGFQPLGELADYWHEPGEPPVACVRCGAVCRCSAVLMRRSA